MLSCNLSQAACTDQNSDFYTTHMILFGRKFVLDVNQILKICMYILG